MNSASRRIFWSFIVLGIWLFITVYGARFLGGGQKSLTDSINASIAWNIFAAGVFLAFTILLFGWKDMRFQLPIPGSLKALWFPLLYLLLFFGVALFFGLPSISVLTFVLINTALVGFSEEAAFRGVIYRGLRSRIGIAASVVVSSLLFGSVHILNIFTTGEVFASFIQALVASMSGFVMVAIMLRTGSIIAAMIYHALWDFGTFVMASSIASTTGTTGGAVEPSYYAFIPFLFVLPNFLYALWLLKNLRKHPEVHALA